MNWLRSSSRNLSVPVFFSPPRMSSVAERDTSLEGWFVKVTEVLVLVRGGSAVCVCVCVCMCCGCVALSLVSC